MPFKITKYIFLGLFYVLFNQEAWSQAEVSSANGSEQSDYVENPELVSETQIVERELVITHPSNTTDKISLNELRAIFSLRARTWPDGTPIQVFVMRDGSETHRHFLQRALKMLPHQLRRHWDRYIYSGIGQGPTIVNSQEEMLIKVRITPGSIGYVSGGMADEAVHLLSIK